MPLQLTITAVDKTNQVEWPTLQKMDVLTKEPDRLEFRIKNYPSKTYRPSLSEEVILLDGATRIFGGVITESRESNTGLLKFFEVICKDFQHTMDQKLVNKTYTAQSANAIITDIKNNFLPAGFTVTNVNAPDTIQKIVFNDEQPSKCFQRIAEMLGNYDWYVDYNKDIHFFKEGGEMAPFNLDDAGGKYIFGSLRIERNINQIRNSIIVRGGDKESSLLDNTEKADGTQRVFVAKPSLKNLTIQKSTDTTCGAFTTLTIGQDGVDDPTTKDVLYNPNTGHVIFRDNNKPAQNFCVKWSGNQVYPIKIIRRDWPSINTFGEYQYIIRDATIKSEDQAKQRAAAELLKYANKASEGSFRTTSSGLRSGQRITIESAALGMATETFKINRVIFRARSSAEFDYEAHILASEEVGVIDVFSKLLVDDPAKLFRIDENEVLVQVEGYTETITMADSFTATKYPRVTPTYTETVSMSDSFTVNPWGLNVIPIWVAGAYYLVDGNDRKRAPRTDAGAKTT